MSTTKNIANHLRHIHSGVNWTWSNYKDQLADITWQQATTKIYNLNTIATLVQHIHYYMPAIITVLEGGKLEASDKASFNLPPITSAEEWSNLQTRLFNDAEKLASLIEDLPEENLWKIFSEEKYGSYYRNLSGLIEHHHYHLGQIVVIKKILTEQEALKKVK